MLTPLRYDKTELTKPVSHTGGAHNANKNQQQSLLRDILLKYEVIEKDDSKLFAFEDNNNNNNNNSQNSYDSQKSSTFLSQYRRAHHQTTDQSIPYVFATPWTNNHKKSLQDSLDESDHIEKHYHLFDNKPQNVMEEEEQGVRAISYPNYSPAKKLKPKNPRKEENISSINNHNHKPIKAASSAAVIGKPLKGKVVFVDVHTNDGECISDSFHVLLQKLGADIKKKFTPKLDYMIWKDGSLKNYENAEKHAVKIVNLQWLERCGTEGICLDYNQFLVPKPNRSTAAESLSLRVDRIYKKYEREEKNRIKELPSKITDKPTIIIDGSNHISNPSDTDYMVSWQNTDAYKAMSELLARDQIRGQDHLEQFYHDVINQCYSSSFGKKRYSREAHNRMIIERAKYIEETIMFQEDIKYYHSVNTSDGSCIYTNCNQIDRSPEELSVTLYVGQDSLKKQQRTLQDFFKLTPIFKNNSNKDNDVNNHNNNNRQSNFSIVVGNKNNSAVKPNGQVLREIQGNVVTHNNTNIIGKNSNILPSQHEQKNNNLAESTVISTITTVPSTDTSCKSNSQQTAGKNLHPLFEMTSAKRENQVIQDSDVKISKNGLLTSSSSKSLLIPPKKKGIFVNITNQPSGHKKPIHLSSNTTNSLLRFGFSVKKPTNKPDSLACSQNSQKQLKIGYMNLNALQMQQLQKCVDLLNMNYILCEENELFQEDILILGNGQILKQLADNIVNTTANSLNCLRVIGLLINPEKAIVNFQWVEDCLLLSSPLPIDGETAQDYQINMQIQAPRTLFSGFTFSVYLDGIQRKNDTLMNHKAQLEAVIYYFGGKLLENTKNATYVIFFKKYGKSPLGYDLNKCITDMVKEGKKIIGIQFGYLIASSRRNLLHKDNLKLSDQMYISLEIEGLMELI